MPRLKSCELEHGRYNFIMTHDDHSQFWFDAHLDLAYLALAGRDMLADALVAGGPNLPGCITLPTLRAGNVRWALGTIFTEARAPQNPYGYRDSDDIAGARQAGIRQLEIYQQWEAQGHIRIIRSADDLDIQPADDAPLQVILLMECADPIADVDDASWWYEQGVRVVGLSWTHGSRYSGGNGIPAEQRGLTELGQALVRRFDELGIVHDLSHLNESTAIDLLAQTTGPVIASHSASRTLQMPALPKVEGVAPEVVAQRHISDAQLMALQARQGMVGLPLYSRFVCENQNARPTQDRVVDHLDYLADQLGGRDRVGIGSDFDGGFSALQTPVNMEGPLQLHTLLATLRSRGWSDKEIRGLACDNWLRYFKRVLS